jgi:UDP-N-acetylglucosamine 2-epimerase (non-hydrolysing)
MRIAVVQGTRPEIIKNYSVVQALRAATVPFEVLHTNQHRTPSMCHAIYRDMGYTPDRTMRGQYRLGIAIDWLQQRFRRDRITHVIVNGDTAASLAGALAAIYLDLHVSHIEAGLRSRDTQMLEERNRIMVDAVAHSLFAYTRHEHDALLKTPEVRGRVYLEGNTTQDVLFDFRHRMDTALIAGRYVFVTMHRKEFTDSRQRMLTVFEMLREIAATQCAVVLPLHPRTQDALRRHGLGRDVLGDIEILGPVPVFESLALQKHAAAVITDSGCIQEEAYLLGVPCVTVRDNTERHLTVTNGANVITGFSPAKMRAGVQWALTLQQRNWPDIYGSQGAGARIVQRIGEWSCTAQPPVGLSYA